MLLENKKTTWIWEHREDGTISEQIYDTLLVDVHRDGQIVSLQSTSNNDAEWSIYEMDLFVDHVVTYQRSRQEERCRFVIQSSDGQMFLSDETIIDPFSKLTPSGNMHYDTDILRYCLEKPYQPRATYEFNMTTHHLESLAKTCAPTSHNMIEERMYATSPGGTQIPITVFSRDDSTLDRVLLVGYGAYGKSAEWSYDPLFHYLLNQGVVVAYANIPNDKISGIKDYIACAECLRSHGNVTAYGVSAGGVVVGASLQQAPHVFHSGILVNAFLDVEATLRNPGLYLTKEDWEEYGNPELDPSIASYCPVRNVSPGGPPVLVLASLDDERVPYWNALIYTHKRGTESTHLYMEPSGGHTWNCDRQRMMALQASFVFHSQ
jgi:protease II